MRIEEALRIMRSGKVVRCKRRYYALDEDEVMMRVFIKNGTVFTRGVANISGVDIMTEEWEETVYLYNRRFIDA